MRVGHRKKKDVDKKEHEKSVEKDDRNLRNDIKYVNHSKDSK